jgi:formate--tetrahydrofolate ligase
VHPICSEMRTLPGLGSSPTAFRFDLDDQGQIMGLS